MYPSETADTETAPAWGNTGAIFLGDVTPSGSGDRSKTMEPANVQHAAGFTSAQWAKARPAGLIGEDIAGRAGADLVVRIRISCPIDNRSRRQSFLEKRSARPVQRARPPEQLGSNVPAALQADAAPGRDDEGPTCSSKKRAAGGMGT